MPFLMLKDVPRYECLLNAAERYPSLDPGACEAFFHLLRTGDTVFSAEGRFLAGHGISQGRFMVLMLLNRNSGEPSTPAELADEAGVTRATMTGVLDTLEKDGLVKREHVAADRRTIRVCLTDAGRAFLKSVTPDYFRSVSTMLDPLSATERKQLVRLLQKIQAHVNPESAGETQPVASRN